MNVLVGIGVGVMFGLVLLAYAVPLTLLRGWAIQMLWGWFIVPTFGMRPLRIVEAIGLALFVGMFVVQADEHDEHKDKKKLWIKVISPICNPLIAVGVGWIIHRWM